MARPIKVLVVGSGAREHALCFALEKSSLLSELLCAPGNPGIASLARLCPVAADDVAGLAALAQSEGVGLVVVGPEAPLVAGLADRLIDLGIRVFGPRRDAARIEGSKAFAKQIMRDAGIPTAGYEVFDDPEAAARHVASAAARGPVVVKADGLAAGKGVIICPDAVAAQEAVRALMVRRAVGQGGARVVVEEFLEGEEASAIALCDGRRHLMLPSAQDHKRLLDGDQGPNTGGMGAYSPAPVLPPALLDEVGRTVIAPALAALSARGATFRGALYAGLMITEAGPKVLEFNCRLGDPETQALLLRLKGDLLPVLLAVAEGELRGLSLDWDPRPAVGVVLASEGYPEAPKRGAAIRGLDQIAAGADLQAFHAGTASRNGEIVTAGGRVLTVCALGESVAAARAKAYGAIEKIHFEGMQFRRDIAARALR